MGIIGYLVLYLVVRIMRGKGTGGKWVHRWQRGDLTCVEDQGCEGLNPALRKGVTDLLTKIYLVKYSVGTYYKTSL